jgi:hypothetical protein
MLAYCSFTAARKVNLHFPNPQPTRNLPQLPLFLNVQRLFPPRHLRLLHHLPHLPMMFLVLISLRLHGLRVVNLHLHVLLVLVTAHLTPLYLHIHLVSHMSWPLWNLYLQSRQTCRECCGWEDGR